ncbi:MAG TPA: outer membrane protein assembly factor BamD, partial [bacterium]|nr:outer membrane protein assembly factor BamD [bacterium]
KVIDNYPSYKRFIEIVEREYRIGNLYLAGEKASIAGMKILPGKDKAIEVFEHIVRSAPFSSYAPRAQFNVGEAYRSIKRYSEAIPEYQKVVNNYPESELVVEASYQACMCGYLRSSEAPYDQTATNIAVGSMKDFLAKYPRSRKAPDVRAKLTSLVERRASKSYDIAKFYDKEGSDEAAIIYYQDVINENPGTQMAIAAEKRIDELIIKPTSKKYDDTPKKPFLSNLKMPSIPIPFMKKKAVETPSEQPLEAVQPAAQQAPKKKIWEFWKKPAVEKKVAEEPAAAPLKEKAAPGAKKNFWEVWKKDEKKPAKDAGGKFDEGSSLTMKGAPKADEPKATADEGAPLEDVKKVADSKIKQDIDKELAEEPQAVNAGELKHPAFVSPAAKPTKEVDLAGKQESRPAEQAAPAAPAETEKPAVEQVGRPSDETPSEIPKELDVVQIVDLKLVETNNGCKLVFITNKPAQYAAYELKNPTRLMIAMKSPVYSRLDDRIDIGKAGFKSVRSHYRNREETESGWQVNAFVIDFEGHARFQVTDEDNAIIVQLQ